MTDNPEITNTGPDIAHLPEALRGRYRIDAELGRGSMGVVYRAFDLRLDRPVAFKELYPGLTRGEDPGRVQARFLREARLAARLTHPNIVTIFDIILEEDRWFLVMELLEGQSLRQLLEESSRVSPGQARDWVLQAAQALGAAHRAGIIHRDIKPENLLVLRDGRLKIMDFGIALSADSTRLTRAGGTMGTPAYLAPELLQGAEPDARSDLFALGVVFYELLSGRNPFSGGTVTQVLTRIVNRPPPSLTSVQPGLSPDLAAIADRLLQYIPAKRYPGAEALIYDLELARVGGIEPPEELSEEHVTLDRVSGGSEAAPIEEATMGGEPVAEPRTTAPDVPAAGMVSGLERRDAGGPGRSWGRRMALGSVALGSVALLSLGAWLWPGRSLVGDGAGPGMEESEALDSSLAPAVTDGSTRTLPGNAPSSPRLNPVPNALGEAGSSGLTGERGSPGGTGEGRIPGAGEDGTEPGVGEDGMDPAGSREGRIPGAGADGGSPGASGEARIPGASEVGTGSPGRGPGSSRSDAGREGASASSQSSRAAACSAQKTALAQMKCLETQLRGLPRQSVPSEARTLLLKLMEKEALQQRALALAPAALSKDELTGKMTRWLDSSDSTRRWAAAEVLGKLGKPVPEVDLRRRDLSDEACPVRRDAALYFVEHPTPSLKPDLEQALERSITVVKEPNTSPIRFLVKTKKVKQYNCDHEALEQALDALKKR